MDENTYLFDNDLYLTKLKKMSFKEYLVDLYDLDAEDVCHRILNWILPILHILITFGLFVAILYYIYYSGRVTNYLIRKKREETKLVKKLVEYGYDAKIICGELIIKKIEINFSCL